MYSHHLTMFCVLACILTLLISLQNGKARPEAIMSHLIEYSSNFCLYKERQSAYSAPLKKFTAYINVLLK